MLEVKSVKFLVPVTIEYISDGQNNVIFGQMDYAKKELYLDGVNKVIADEIKNKTFQFLNITSKLPEDKFALSEEDTAKIEAAEKIYRDCKNFEQYESPTP